MSVCRVICMYGSIVTGYVTSGAFRKSIDGFSTRTGPPEPFSIAEPTSDRLPASGESAAAASHMCGGAAATTSPLPLPALSTHRRGRLPLRRQRRRRGVRPFTDRCRRCLRRLGHRRGDRGRRNHQQGRLHRQPRDRCDHSPGCTTEPNGGERCVRLPKRGDHVDAPQAGGIRARRYGSPIHDRYMRPTSLVPAPSSTLSRAVFTRQCLLADGPGIGRSVAYVSGVV